MAVPYFQEILDNYAVFDEKKEISVHRTQCCLPSEYMCVRSSPLHREKKKTPIWGFSHWVD